MSLFDLRAKAQCVIYLYKDTGGCAFVAKEGGGDFCKKHNRDANECAAREIRATLESEVVLQNIREEATKTLGPLPAYWPKTEGGGKKTTSRRCTYGCCKKHIVRLALVRSEPAQSSGLRLV